MSGYKDEYYHFLLKEFRRDCEGFILPHLEELTRVEKGTTFTGFWGEDFQKELDRHPIIRKLTMKNKYTINYNQNTSTGIHFISVYEDA